MSEIERDPRIDAAWRAANRDEPPAHLDDAIRAAARRAVEPGPRRKRDKHWWYPFAAAATVAVIAVGLLQLTPPDQVTPTIVSDLPKVAHKNAASAPVPSSAPAAPGAPSGARASLATRPDSSSEASNSFAPTAPPPVAAKKEATVDERARIAGAMQREQKPQRQLDTAEKPAPVQEQDSARNIAVPASPPAEARRGEPFPAARPEFNARRDAAVGVQAENTTRVEEAEPAAAPPAIAPPAAAPSAAAPGTSGGTLHQKRAEAQGALAKDALEAAPRMKTAARSVEDWIKLIRQLKSEGRIEEATKEVVSFRSAYGERADSLLPADLRALSPAAPASAK
jgi:hypothetical protein